MPRGTGIENPQYATNPRFGVTGLRGEAGGLSGNPNHYSGIVDIDVDTFDTPHGAKKNKRSSSSPGSADGGGMFALSSWPREKMVIAAAIFLLVVGGIILAATQAGGGAATPVGQAASGNGTAGSLASSSAALGAQGQAEASVDCAERHDPCTAACERADSRNYTIITEAVHTGTACTGPADCQPGDGACRATAATATTTTGTATVSTTTTHAKDCEYTVSACTAACEFGVNRSITVTQEPVGSTGKACPTPGELPDCEPAEDRCPFWTRCHAGEPGHLSAEAVAAQPDGFPFTVPAEGQGVALPKSETNVLLILREIPFDCSTMMPRARSHSGYLWEGVVPHPIHPVCDKAAGSCTVDVKDMVRNGGGDGDGGGFRIDAYVRPEDETPTEGESTARLLLQGTFGPTQEAINDAVSQAGKDQKWKTNDRDTAVATAWVESQLALPPTLLRPRYRRAANPRVFHDQASGGVAEPCQVGSRWNRFAFDKLDVGKVLVVESDVASQSFRLTVDGVNRGETDVLFGEVWPGVEATPLQAMGGGDGLCLGVPSAGNGVKPTMMSCDSQDAKTMWKYNAHTKLLTITDANRCLDDAGGTTRVQMWDCNSINPNQYFEWDSVTKMLRSNKGGKCLNAPTGSQLGTEVDLQTCDEAAIGMKWELAPEKSKTVAGPTRMLFVCVVYEEAPDPDQTILGHDTSWFGLRVSAVGGDYSCNDALHAKWWMKMENPLIHFANPDPDSVELFSKAELAFEPVWTPNANFSGMSMVTTKVASKCKGVQVAGKTFFGLKPPSSNGETVYYQYDRRLKWIDNSPEAPADITADEYTGGRHGVCPKVPRTFVNEGSCVRQPAGTCTAPVFLSKKLMLDKPTLQRWFTDSTKYVYAVTGLRIEAGEVEAVPPCTFGASSRWVRVSTSGGCSGAGGSNSVVLTSGTAAVVKAAIVAYGQPLDENEPYANGPDAKNSGYACDGWVGSLDHAVVKCNADTSCRYLHNFKGDGKTWRFCSSVDFAFGADKSPAAIMIKPGGSHGAANPRIRDVAVGEYTADNGGDCSMDDSTIGSHVDVDGSCWKHSHPNEGNVYDMSRWTFQHPGTRNAMQAKRRNPITRWAEDGQNELWFPSHHPMYRFRDSEKSANNMQLIGKLDDEVDFANLPSNLQTDTLAELLDAIGDYPDIGFETCGSRGEVANEPAKGHRYQSTNTANADPGYLDQKSSQTPFQGTGKWVLWGSVVLHAQDQLRQRIAWALSQILVIGDGDVAFYSDHTETWAAYYDIFITHAFGNYRDILREVSASPLMGTYLTMKGNVAFAHGGKYPDENYAREIMQLFSIGLWQLNDDGTPIIDPNTNQYINTYSNDDIVSFARVWTGWNLQPARGNIHMINEADAYVAHR